MKKLNADFKYLPDMYHDKYYPEFLVDKVKAEIVRVVSFIEEGSHDTDEIQQKFDAMTIAINYLDDEFGEHDSELETVAREDIGDTVQRIIDYFELGIDCEDAIRERDW